MKDKHPMPVIHKGRPLPDYKVRDGRNGPRRKTFNWTEYLNALVDGDSFDLELPMANTLRAYARTFSIPLIWMELLQKGPNGRPAYRFWKVSEETLAKYTH